MGKIIFYCQNVNVVLPPSFGVSPAAENLEMLCPPATNPAPPQPSYPSYSNYQNGGCSQPAIPTYPESIPPVIVQPEPPSGTCQQSPQPPPPQPPALYPEITYPSQPEMPPPSAISGSFSPFLENEIFDLTNLERANHGLPPLSANHILGDVARRKSLNMGDLDYFSHTAPDGTTTADWLRNEGHTFSRWGENIANLSANATARDIIAAWMNSPGHRANILDENFTLLGVGVYVINDRLFATQVFGRLNG